MDSKTKASNRSRSTGVAEEEENAPAGGSWVTELEEAKAELAKVLLGSLTKEDGAAAARKRRGSLLPQHLRLCRAYCTLRQWDGLEEAATGGLKVCASLLGKRGAAAVRVSEWKARFASYRQQARRETSVPSYLNMDGCKSMLRASFLGLAELPSMAKAAIIGDMRLMEAQVAQGAAIDAPVKARSCPGNPANATPLLTVCLDIAGHDAEHTTYDGNPTEAFLRMLSHEIDKGTECAMQLVRLGADPSRKLRLGNAPDTIGYRAAGFDGKTALELARMTNRTKLVELMEQHLRYTPEERAQVVHCRCGSRLPWKECHGGAGVRGQPPHYVVDGKGRVAYRLSPLARCPCNTTTLTHYECCWKTTWSPSYLVDATGQRLRAVPTPRGRGQFDAFANPGSASLPPGAAAKKAAAHHAARLQSDPDALQKAFTPEGPKGRVASWDPRVYAGCLARLGDDDGFFLWTDLHWKLDESELLRRARAWNKALKAYCRHAGLVGKEWDHVVDKHRANPSAPCGRVGCNAFEKQPKAFQRCSCCKAIAYCGRACQKLDWTEHRKVCGDLGAKR